MRKPTDNLEDLSRVRGNFGMEDRNLLQAVDRFLTVMTCDARSANRRTSWNAGASSAYSSIARMDRQEFLETRRKLEDAIFKFAIGKRPCCFEEGPSKRLIEEGVAAVNIDSTEESFVQAYLDEPIIVQAGLNFFCL
jgi:hypothetical protein